MNENNLEIGFWEYFKLRISSFIKRKIHQYKYWEKNNTTDTNFKLPSTGEARFIWWHKWEEEEENKRKVGISIENEEK